MIIKSTLIFIFVLSALSSLFGGSSSYSIEAVMYGNKGTSETFEESKLFMVILDVELDINEGRGSMVVNERKRLTSPNIGRDIPSLTLEKVEFKYSLSGDVKFEVVDKSLPEKSPQRHKYLQELNTFSGFLNAVIFYEKNVSGGPLIYDQEWKPITAKDIGYSSPNLVSKKVPNYFRFHDGINEYLMVFEPDGVYCYYHINGAHPIRESIFDALPIFSTSYSDLNYNFYRSITNIDDILQFSKGSSAFIIFKFTEGPRLY